MAHVHTVRCSFRKAFATGSNALWQGGVEDLFVSIVRSTNEEGEFDDQFDRLKYGRQTGHAS